MNPFKVVKYQLYLLELENYNLPRFLRLMWRTNGIPKKAPRKELVWTPKLAATFGTALALKFFVATVFASFFSLSVAIFVFFITLFVFSFSFFIFLTIATILLWPVDFVLKMFIIKAAKTKIAKFPNLKIIAITGSYGKTTMKEALKQVLSVKYQVLATPESVNTPVGISRLILKELGQKTQIFIVEMGAYQRGDIRTLCEIARPQICVLTGINEAHLERFGSLENTVQTKFEIVESASPDAKIVLNGDDKNVKENSRKYVGGRRVYFYGSDDIKDFKFYEDAGGIEILGVKVPVLGEYILALISACVIISKELGLDDTDIRAGISKIKPVPHRLEVLPSAAPGILVIDDSYNGNPDGVREAIKVLARFKNKRKIYITPGLVEMGQGAKGVHVIIGRELAGVADIVVLIKNSVTPYIEEGIRSAFSQKKAQILWFRTTKEAHAAVPGLIKSGDVILFQNDWPDNYL